MTIAVLKKAVVVLDPLTAHAPARMHLTDPNLRGTIKEPAQLDGAFVISDAGTVVAACRYLDASAEQIDLSLGLGSRHLAPGGVDLAEARRDRNCRVRERCGPCVPSWRNRGHADPRTVAAGSTPRPAEWAPCRRGAPQRGSADRRARQTWMMDKFPQPRAAWG